MIENRLQYDITQTQIRNLRDAFELLNTSIGLDPVLVQAHCDCLKSEIEVLQRQVEEYERNHENL